MKNLKIFRFMGDRAGATALEYALIASLISIALIGGASTMGNAINTSMNDVSQHLKNSQ